MRDFYEWHPAKADTNVAKHGVHFRAARRFEWETALKKIDMRGAYGEVRCTAIGFIGERLHVMAYTRRGAFVRLISLRKANAREIRHYVEF